jgi:hypothetical protein
MRARFRPTWHGYWHFISLYELLKLVHLVINSRRFDLSANNIQAPMLAILETALVDDVADEVPCNQRRSLLLPRLASCLGLGFHCSRCDVAGKESRRNSGTIDKQKSGSLTRSGYRWLNQRSRCGDPRLRSPPHRRH